MLNVFPWSKLKLPEDRQKSSTVDLTQNVRQREKLLFTFVSSLFRKPLFKDTHEAFRVNGRNLSCLTIRPGQLLLQKSSKLDLITSKDISQKKALFICALRAPLIVKIIIKRFQSPFQGKQLLPPNQRPKQTSRMKPSEWASATKISVVALNTYLIFSLNFVGIFAHGSPNQRLQHRSQQNEVRKI